MSVSAHCTSCGSLFWVTGTTKITIDDGREETVACPQCRGEAHLVHRSAPVPRRMTALPLVARAANGEALRRAG